MKKQNRKAFTIVELVIVIAVIGILAAVLIPTFSGIIKSANISSDEATAASLTAELRVSQVGGDITNEAELIAALEKTGIGAKLTPKALQYGYHFWFDMKTQTIRVETTENVSELPKIDYDSQIAAANDESGVTLINDAAEPTPTNVSRSFRDVYGVGYYLIDAAGSSYSAYAVELIDTLNRATDYEALIENVLVDAIAKDEDTVLAKAIYDKVLETTIHTRSGSYFCDNQSKYEYFTSKSNSIGTKYYNYTTSGGDVAEATSLPIPTVAEGERPVVSIPTHLVYIPTGALNYATVEAVTFYLPTTDFAASVFSPASTNALIQLGDQTLVHVITTVTDEDDNTLDVLKTKETVGVDQTYTAILSSLLPFDEFVIGTPETENVSVRTEGDKIYVLSKNGTLQLYAVNAENENETSGRIKLWEVTDTSKGSFVIDSKTGVIDLTTCTSKTVGDYTVCEVIVKATADTVSGGTATDTVTIVVAMPVSASLKVSTHPKQSLPETLSHANNGVENGNDMTLYFTGDLFSYDVYDIDASYTTDSEGNDAYALATGGTSSENAVPVISVAKKDVNGNDTVFAYDGTNNRLILNTPDVATGEKYNLTLLVDSCLPINSLVTASDAEQVVLDTTYRYDSTTARPYYIGSGNAISLDEIFKETDLFDTDVTATINIYDAVGNSGKLYPLYLANRSYGRLNVTKNGVDSDSFVISAGDLDSIDLGFTFVDTTEKSCDIYIEIIPVRADAAVATADAEGTQTKPELNSLVLKFTVVNGAMNVFADDIDAVDAIFNPASGTGKDVVLYTDLTAETGDTISIGANQTLYGNGFVIDAKSYKSGEEKTYYKWESIGRKDVCTECKTIAPADGSVCKTKTGEKTASGQDGHGNWSDGFMGIGRGWKNFETKNIYGEKSYPYYASSDASMIQINGGTIDNIYIDGPVYPELQYLVSDGSVSGAYLEATNKEQSIASTIDVTTSTINVVTTPYYVSGIKVTGNSTISNSYVSGFRQPVQVKGNEHTVDSNNKTIYGCQLINTTLRGGNFANLLLSDGDLYLKDVTTIQDQNGMQATIADSDGSYPYVVGVGINISKDALGSQVDIVIEGYLEQYNWIKHDVANNAKMPSISASGVTLDTGELFSWVFNGADVTLGVWPFQLNVKADAGSGKYFINQTKGMSVSSRTEGFINAGIVFAEIGSTSEVDAMNPIVVIDDDLRTDGPNQKKRPITDLDMRFGGEDGVGVDIPQSLMNVELIAKIMELVLGGNRITAQHILGTDGRFIAYSYRDGRGWTPQSMARDGTTLTRYVNPTDGTTRQYVLSDSKQYIDNSGYAIIYRGYYDGFSHYADKYVTNSDNTILPPVAE